MKRDKKITGLLMGILCMLLAACTGAEVPETTEGLGISTMEAVEVGVTGEVSEATVDRQESGSPGAVVKDIILSTESVESKDIEDMQVHFIDVGQGDATLIVCDGEAMLIDAGDDSKGTFVQNYLRKQGIKELKYLILTHTDADHIGGSDVIVSKFEIENVFIGDFPKQNRVYENLMDALGDMGLDWITPSVGSTYSLGPARFTILAPNEEYDDPNDCSIALLLENGEDSFLFTGDAEERAEADILKNGLSVDCDVFKAGHHGSKTSNSSALLKAASPEVVVISCAQDNSYGHPHAGPMNLFRSMGAVLYRTDEQGSVIATSTGEGITWNAAPSDSWQAGEPKGSSNPTASSGSRQNQNASQETVAPTQAPEVSWQEAPVSKEAGQEPAEPAYWPQPVDSAGGELVWKSATGEKYHSINNCGRMNPDKATQITLDEAAALGLGQCSKCF